MRGHHVGPFQVGDDQTEEVEATDARSNKDSAKLLRAVEVAAREGGGNVEGCRPWPCRPPRTVLLGLAAIALWPSPAQAGAEADEHAGPHPRAARCSRSGWRAPIRRSASRTTRATLTGFDVAFARALAKRLGVEAQFQPAPFAGLLGSVEAGAPTW